MARAKMIKQKVLLHIVPSESPRGPVFFKEHLDESGFARMFSVSRKDWTDLGQPVALTLTIKPGDRMYD